jgi:hypothetical protein
MHGFLKKTILKRPSVIPDVNADATLRPMDKVTAYGA